MRLHFSKIDHRPSTIDHRPSTIDHRPSTIDHRPSTRSIVSITNIKDTDENFSFRFGSISLKGDWQELGGHLFYFRHTLYELDKTPEAYFEEYIKDPELFVKSRRGEFLLLDFDPKNLTLKAVTDHLCDISTFLYFENKIFFLSNDLWDCANYLVSGVNNIDIQAIKRYVLYYRPLINRTFIKGLNLMTPASVYDFRLGEDFGFVKKRYWELKFKPDLSVTLHDAVNRIDEAFNSTFELLCKKFDAETRFGIGLSGGLDSRAVIHYACKHGLKLVPYCFGQRYSFLRAKTYGYKTVSALAEHFGLTNLKFVDYDSEPYADRLAYDVLYNTELPANFIMGGLKDIPDFDIMLNGEKGGEFFGQIDGDLQCMLSENKNSMGSFLGRTSAALQDYQQIMTLEEREELVLELQNYVDGLNTDDVYEINAIYFFDVRGMHTKTGFLESNYGTKDRYSPFLDPKFFEQYLTWNPMFRIGRVLQRQFFIDKMPMLAKIPDETSDAPLYWRKPGLGRELRRLYGRVMRKTFKPALRREHWLLHDIEYRRLYKAVMLKLSDIVKFLFPALDTERFFFLNPRAAANLLKSLVIIDTMINSKRGEEISYVRTMLNE